ncbi:hypothetical protein DIE17_31665 [Burkholderia sp. Bp9099]|nr:hypothetical protein DIE17_31665 [Burkholderia sp. Bp9099]
MYGVWQAEGKVRHLIVSKLADKTELLGTLPTTSRAFSKIEMARRNQASHPCQPGRRQGDGHHANQARQPRQRSGQ